LPLRLYWSDDSRFILYAHDVELGANRNFLVSELRGVGTAQRRARDKAARAVQAYVSPCEKPEGLTAELLTILAEECCEAAVRVSKALRFGLAEVQPGQALSNATRLAHELGDIVEVTRRLLEVCALEQADIDAGQAHKAQQLAKFLQSAS
jgi:hypothetical protein